MCSQVTWKSPNPSFPLAAFQVFEEASHVPSSLLFILRALFSPVVPGDHGGGGHTSNNKQTLLVTDYVQVSF